MAKTADISSKLVIGLAPEEWVRWATKIEGVKDCEVLSGELQLVSRETDSLVLVKQSSVGRFLALFEIQTRYLPEMPRRMRAYAALAEAKFDLPVFPILVVILPYGKLIADRYESNYFGLQARQDYRVIKLWEISAGGILAQNLTALLPFLPTMNGASEALIERAKTRLVLDENLRETGKAEDYRAILSLFTEAIFGTEIARKIFGGKMLEIIAETSLYKEILSRGMKEGVQQGLQQGREEELRKVLLKQLSKRFGDLDEKTRGAVQNLSLDKAETLAEAMFDFESAADLETWLANA